MSNESASPAIDLGACPNCGAFVAWCIKSFEFCCDQCRCSSCEGIPIAPRRTEPFLESDRNVERMVYTPRWRCRGAKQCPKPISHVVLGDSWGVGMWSRTRTGRVEIPTCSYHLAKKWMPFITGSDITDVDVLTVEAYFSYPHISVGDLVGDG